MAWKYRWALVALVALLALILPSAVAWKRTGTTPLSMPFPFQSAAAKLSAADFGALEPSADTRRLADWVARSGDHAGVGFVVIDKKQARIFVFDGKARVLGDSPILLGGAPGDDSVPDIGNRKVDELKLHERTTAAGRFVAQRGRNMRDEDVVWVSYDDALSIHKVLLANPAERRLERLATPTVADNRISSGCINVPAKFFEQTVLPVFARQRAMVYILPEHKSLEDVFRMATPGRILASNTL
jgi:hypothetical protein